MACTENRIKHPLSDRSKTIVQTLTTTPSNDWQLVDSIPLQFDTYHPQGIVKVGEEFYLTSVKTERRPKYSRKGKEIKVADEGSGKGYLFRFNTQGQLLQTIELWDRTMFHPGGMDFDGKYIWIPVTKYYPYSRSFIARIDIRTHEIEKIGYVDDSVGAIIYNPDDNTLIGANWNADEFITWNLDEHSQIINPTLPIEQRRTLNADKHLAIQDAKYIGNYILLGFGLKTGSKGIIGGFDLIDTRTFKQIYSGDIALRTPKHQVIVTGNPSTIEIKEKVLRFYFAPKDNQTTVYIYEAKLVE